MFSAVCIGSTRLHCTSALHVEINDIHVGTFNKKSHELVFQTLHELGSVTIWPKIFIIWGFLVELLKIKWLLSKSRLSFAFQAEGNRLRKKMQSISNEYYNFTQKYPKVHLTCLTVLTYIKVHSIIFSFLVCNLHEHNNSL